MSEISSTWMIICNPKAGAGRAVRDWAHIEEALKKYGIRYEYRFSKYHRHAIRLAEEAYDMGFRHFVAVGGDGTLNELVNGVAARGRARLEDSEFALIPVGKGNDWARSTDIPHSYEKAVALLQNGRKGTQEIACVRWTNGNGETEERLFVNMFGAGFDSYVVERIVKKCEKKKKLSAMSYLLELLRSLFSYKSRPARIRIREQILEVPLFTLAAGIGEYNGGGMRQCPGSDMNDGLLEITVVRKVSLLTVIFNLPGLFSGKFVQRKEVSRHRSPAMKLEGAGLSMEVDGELLGKAPGEIYVIKEKLHTRLP